MKNMIIERGRVNSLYQLPRQEEHPALVSPRGSLMKEFISPVSR